MTLSKAMPLARCRHMHEVYFLKLGGLVSAHKLTVGWQFQFRNLPITGGSGLRGLRKAVASSRHQRSERSPLIALPLLIGAEDSILLGQVPPNLIVWTIPRSSA